MSDFGPNSRNPRLRRAYAHTQLHNLRNGEGTFAAAREAIDAASCTRKGEQSNFEPSLIRAVLGKASSASTVFVDWTGGLIERPAFGGYAMTQEEADAWSAKHRDAVDNKNHEPYNKIFDAGYLEVTLTMDPEQRNEVTWGQGYDLRTNPASAHIESFRAPENS